MKSTVWGVMGYYQTLHNNINKSQQILVGYRLTNSGFKIKCVADSLLEIQIAPLRTRLQYDSLSYENINMQSKYQSQWCTHQIKWEGCSNLILIPSSSTRLSVPLATRSNWEGWVGCSKPIAASSSAKFSLAGTGIVSCLSPGHVAGPSCMGKDFGCRE